MTITGIIAEYNPFHLGHAYQIAETKRRIGPDSAIVCVMSGDYVQRGEPAIFSKFVRARAALSCGADLVIELPLPWSMASAEYFAGGAVAILNGLGVVDYLSFGSESADLDGMYKIVQAEKSTDFSQKIKSAMEEGISYPAARTAVLEELTGGKAEALRRPNDTLGIEYLKALDRQHSTIQPLVIRRVGAGHDQYSAEIIKSASELRAMLARGENIGNHVPQNAYTVFMQEIRQGRGPVTGKAMEGLVLSRLRMMDLENFQRLPDAAEGLERKLYKACQTEPDLESIIRKVKSKRYTYARIRRMCMFAALGIDRQMLTQMPTYGRILACNLRGTEILRCARKTASIEMVNRPSSVRKLDHQINSIFACNAKAHDLYVLGYQNNEYHRGGEDWTTSPWVTYE